MLFDAPPPQASVKAAIMALMPYVDREISHGRRLHSITRHLHGLFHAVPGARAFRRHLATEAFKPGATAAVLQQAVDMVLDRGADAAHIAA
jgi:tRNA-dihydrouridine synthase A